MAALQNHTGTVTKTNHTSFQLDGEKWISISRFADPMPEMPGVGQRVTVGLDAKEFARTIQAVSSSTVQAVAPGAAPLKVPAPVPISALNRETVITRLACLKAASVFAASRPDMKSPDLLILAERLEAWVNR